MIMYNGKKLSTTQSIILSIIAIVILVLFFMLAMTLLPFILMVGVYFWYRARKKMQNIREYGVNGTNDMGDAFYQQETYRYINTEERNTESTQLRYNTSSRQNNKDEQAIIYDISPENYTVEEKK